MKKYVELLLVWLVVGVCVEAMTLEERRNDCNNYCNRACMFPSKFCKWWCGGRCQNPILWEDSAIKNIADSVDGDVSKKYPVPTEENFKAYESTHPSSTPKIEM
ncbi:hypothetical protein VNO80_16734 [Phaseolus coccineus]|uniref:Uncharacterized protein n=1 Tax=Phaseolus coccineus TaxID=3886 RepID=A0AAN9MS93_PHACN